MSNPEVGAASSSQSLVPRLADVLERGRRNLARTDLVPGHAKAFVAQVRGRLCDLYGPDSEAVKFWQPITGPLSVDAARSLLRERVAQCSRLLQNLESAVSRSHTAGNRVFIGHGHSPVWRELKDFIADRLGLAWDEFNRQAMPGIHTADRLREMLDGSTFAFLVMTAEDDHGNAKLHARANVIHEIGLFQGRLGTRRAIVLIEDGCEQFSNIHGLSHIPFPHNRMSAAFEDVRRVLEREDVVRK